MTKPRKMSGEQQSILEGLPPEETNLALLYVRVSDRVGLFTQILYHLIYLQSSGSFKKFLCSPQGYNQDIGEESTKEDFAFYFAGMVQHIIVMLHATMEDVVRTVARWRLPRADPHQLKDIPIARPEALGEVKLKELGQLVPHLGMTVDDLVRHSVDLWLDHQTFNSAPQVAAMLARIGIPLDKVRTYFPAIDRISTFRHQIVHTGSINDEAFLTFAKEEDLRHYIEDFYLFAKEVLLEAFPPEHKGRLLICIGVLEHINELKKFVITRETESEETEEETGSGGN